MQPQILSPGLQHSPESDFAAQVAWVCENVLYGLGRTGKEESIKGVGVVATQEPQLGWQRKGDHVGIHFESGLQSLGDPFLSFFGAAAWTQPVVAAVPHEAIGRATWARVAVPTHRFSATGGYGLQGRALLATQPVAVASKEAFPMSYKEVGDAGPCALVSAGVPHAGLLLFVFRTARQSVDGLHVSHALLMANRRHVSVQRSGAYVLVT